MFIVKFQIVPLCSGTHRSALFMLHISEWAANIGSAPITSFLRADSHFTSLYVRGRQDGRYPSMHQRRIRFLRSTSMFSPACTALAATTRHTSLVFFFPEHEMTVTCGTTFRQTIAFSSFCLEHFCFNGFQPASTHAVRDYRLQIRGRSNILTSARYIKHFLKYCIIQMARTAHLQPRNEKE